jgi:hypothetical protein
MKDQDLFTISWVTEPLENAIEKFDHKMNTSNERSFKTFIDLYGKNGIEDLKVFVNNFIDYIYKNRNEI